MNLGDEHEVYGKLGAILLTGGERYYLFVNKYGDVAIMPASMFDEPEP